MAATKKKAKAKAKRRNVRSKPAARVKRAAVKKKVAKKRVAGRATRVATGKTVSAPRKAPAARRPPVRASAPPAPPSRAKAAQAALPTAKPVSAAPERAARPAPPAPVPAATHASAEERIGIVSHYFSHLSVAALIMESGTLRVGETIHVKGHTTDFTQKVDSLQVDHTPVSEVHAGQDFGMKVTGQTREHDVVYKVSAR